MSLPVSVEVSLLPVGVSLLVSLLVSSVPVSVPVLPPLLSPDGGDGGLLLGGFVLGVLLLVSWPVVSELTSSLTVGAGGVTSLLSGIAGFVSPLVSGVMSPLAGADGGVLLPLPELLPARCV